MDLRTDSICAVVIVAQLTIEGEKMKNVLFGVLIGVVWALVMIFKAAVLPHPYGVIIIYGIDAILLVVFVCIVRDSVIKT